ncbi:hypothetical protein [Alkalibacillus haloalkaliphilus]|uniref:Phospholipid phosphatase n=1 Tax=Alkalibacillus haloalkaliphilus TaxID=94136 RepID=A0A511W818_9BACI|nr:hypothetical protein [Alkalibacillus haloalkaliphilus]GEN45532.1 hypothetical protein AHA02nite_13080 [Alkalibacillus haloalkaliphilus]
MDMILFFLIMIFHICLFIVAIGLAYRNGWFVVSNVIILVLLALIYDNAMLAFGKFFGEGARLEFYNEIRFWLHALITPLLLLYAWDTIKRAGVKWAKWRSVTWFVLGLTLFLIIYEIVSEVWGLTLEPYVHNGVLAYTKVGSESGMPLMVMIVTVALLLASIYVGRLQNWIWYFTGVFFMTAGMAAPPPVETGVYDNFLELVLMFSLTTTKAFQDQYDRRR